MKSHLSFSIITFACAAVLNSCAPGAGSGGSVSSAPDNSPAGKVYQEVNNFRRSSGAVELQRHAGLDRLAQNHSEFMLANRGKFKLNGKTVSHYGIEGRSLAARQQYNMRSVSENVASINRAGSNPGPSAVRLWSNAVNDRKNITDSWTHTGVGVAIAPDGTAFCTQIYATANYSQLASRERFTQH